MAALMIRPETRELAALDFAALRTSPAVAALMQQGGLPPPLDRGLRTCADIEKVDVVDYYAAAAALGAPSPLKVAPYTLSGDAKTHRYVLWAWEGLKYEAAPAPEQGPEQDLGGAQGGPQGPQSPQTSSASDGPRWRSAEKAALPGFQLNGNKWVRDAILVHYRKRSIVRPLQRHVALPALGFDWVEAGRDLPGGVHVTTILTNPSPEVVRCLKERSAGGTWRSTRGVRRQ